MYIIVRGKRINRIKTLHLTSCSERRNDKDSKTEFYTSSFVIYDEYDKENQVLYFTEDDLKEIGLGL